jgi:hypothetical protein
MARMCPLAGSPAVGAAGRLARPIQPALSQNGKASPGWIPELSTRTPAKGFRHPRVDVTSWTQSHLMPAFA